MRGGPAFLFGLLLTTIAAPALVNAVHALAAAPVMDSLRAGEPVSKAARLHAAKALAHLTDARALADQAVLLPPGKAEAAAKKALAQRPLDAHTWLRLAHLRFTRGAPAEEVAGAVVASMAAAPTDRPLLFARLPLAAATWTGVKPEDRARVLDQVALAWDVDPDRVRWLLRSPQGVALLRRMFEHTRAPGEPRATRPQRGSEG